MVNKDTHTRFWVTLPNEVFEKLSLESNELNLSVTAYAGQIIAEKMNSGKNSDSKSPEELNNIVTTAVSKKAVGDEFTIKDLFEEDEWLGISRSEKAIAAKILAAIERNSEELEICDVKNKTSVYKKK